MARKLLLIVASLTLIVAGGALFLSMTANATESASVPTTAVYVAAGDLPPGTAGSALGDQQVQKIQVASNAVPPGALADLAPVQPLKTLTPIFKGQILMARQFAESSATGGLPVPAGRNAVSVELNDPARVAGFVQPGSKIAIYEANSGDTAEVLLPAAAVIAVGPATQVGTPGQAPVPNKSVATTIVTLALTTQEAKVLIGHTKAGADNRLYLGLLPN